MKLCKKRKAPASREQVYARTPNIQKPYLFNCVTGCQVTLAKPKATYRCNLAILSHARTQTRIFAIPTVQSSFLAAGHPEKELSADGHVLPSGQHWLPAHVAADPGHFTASPTVHVLAGGVGVGLGVGVGVGVGVGAGDGAGAGPGDGVGA